MHIRVTSSERVNVCFGILWCFLHHTFGDHEQSFTSQHIMMNIEIFVNLQLYKREHDIPVPWLSLDSARSHLAHRIRTLVRSTLPTGSILR